jgi:beta-lactamase regulating signal transducer with metallopeptidase domain
VIWPTMILPTIDWNAVAQASALRIVDCLVVGTLIALFAGMALTFARRTSSGTRFAVWFSTLMAIATLPLLSGISWSHSGNLAQSSLNRPAIMLPESCALDVFIAWALIATWFLVRVGLGLTHLHALRSRCEPVDVNSLDFAVRETLSRAHRQVALCVSDDVSAPTAIGFGRPAILIPRWLMTDMSAPELNQILLHELAHLSRRDDWTNLAQKIVAAIFFFHPAVWWIEKRISLEREMACDDTVLAQTSQPRAYAECLARLAEKSFFRRSMALAQAAVGRIRQTSLRIAQILNPSRSAITARSWKPAVAVVAGFSIACAIGVSRAPQLIAFQNQASLNFRPSLPVASNSLPAQMDSLQSAQPVGAKVWKAMAVVPSTHAIKSRHKQAHVSAQPPVTDDSQSLQSSLALEQPASHPNTSTNVQLAGGRVPPVFSTETVFVVLESNDGAGGHPLCQISVWRVTVVSTVRTPIGKTIPRKT